MRETIYRLPNYAYMCSARGQGMKGLQYCDAFKKKTKIEKAASDKILLLPTHAHVYRPDTVNMEGNCTYPDILELCRSVNHANAYVYEDIQR